MYIFMHIPPYLHIFQCVPADSYMVLNIPTRSLQILCGQKPIRYSGAKTNDRQHARRYARRVRHIPEHYCIFLIIPIGSQIFMHIPAYSNLVQHIAHIFLHVAAYVHIVPHVRTYSRMIWYMFLHVPTHSNILLHIHT